MCYIRHNQTHTLPLSQPYMRSRPRVSRMRRSFHAYLCYVDLDVCLCKCTESTSAAHTDLRASWSVVGQQCAVITPRCLLSNSPQMIGQPLNVNICFGPPLPEVPPTSTPRPSSFFIRDNKLTFCPPV